LEPGPAYEPLENEPPLYNDSKSDSNDPEKELLREIFDSETEVESTNEDEGNANMKFMH
jgi:hypothetical protein